MSDSLQSLFSRCDSVLVFDTETSGLSWQRDEIIEFSAIRLTASGTEEVDEFIRCTRSLPPRIVELTGITDDLLREEGIGKQAFAEAATHPSLGNEFYATLLGLDDRQRAVLRLSANPLVNWLWIGGALMTLAPLLGLTRRERPIPAPTEKASPTKKDDGNETGDDADGRA